MLEKRKQEVLAAYQQSRRVGKLSGNLLSPTTAKLRNECAHVFHHRPNDQIKTILQSFARIGAEIKNANDILALDADKFRPLLNFINGEISNPSTQNVMLLAWLIEEKTNHPPVGVAPKASWFKRKRTVFIVVGVVLLTGVFTYWYLNRKKCMAWNGEAFEKVVCEENVLKGRQVVAIDTSRLARLKRITRPDTLTYWSVNRVWYAKIDSFPEFYTHSGMHPTYEERVLKPVSKYIIDKYIFKKKIVDSLNVN